MKKARDERADESRPEYDLRRLRTNLVLLEPEVRRAFRDDGAVNDALRLVIELRRIGVGRNRLHE